MPGMGYVMDENTVIDVIPKVEQFVPNNPIKYDVVRVLKDNGLKNGEIAKALNISDARISQITHKLKSNHDLTSNTFVRLAARTVKSILKAEPIKVRHTTLDKQGDPVEIINDIYPKHSDRLSAAGMVYDRAQPVKRDVEQGTSISFIQVNVEGYKCR